MESCMSANKMLLNLLVGRSSFIILAVIQFAHAQWLAPRLESVYHRRITYGANGDTLSLKFNEAWLAQRGDTLEGLIMPAKSCTLSLSGIWDGEKYRANIHCVGSKKYEAAKIALGQEYTVFIVPQGLLCDSADSGCQFIPDTLELNGSGDPLRGSALKWGALPRRVGGGQVVMEYSSSEHEMSARNTNEWLECPKDKGEVTYIRRKDGELRCSPRSLISPLKKSFLPPLPKVKAPALKENVWQSENEPLGFPVLKSKYGAIFQKMNSSKSVALANGKVFFFSGQGSIIHNGSCGSSLIDLIASVYGLSSLKRKRLPMNGALAKISRRLMLVKMATDYCLEFGDFKVVQLGLNYQWISETDSGIEAFPVAFLMEKSSDSSNASWKVLWGEDHSSRLADDDSRLSSVIDSARRNLMRGVPNLFEIFKSYQNWRWNRYSTCFPPTERSEDYCKNLDFQLWKIKNNYGVSDTICLLPSEGLGEGCVVVDAHGKVSGAPRFRKLPGWKTCLGWDCQQLDTTELVEQGIEQICEFFWSSPWIPGAADRSYSDSHSNYWTVKSLGSSGKKWTGKLCFQAAHASGCLQVGKSGKVTGSEIFKAVKHSCGEPDGDSEETPLKPRLGD